MATAQPPLWNWHDLQQALGLSSSNAQDASLVDLQVEGIAFDSRKAQPGDLFVALPGDPGPGYNVSQRSDRDGHAFIDSALANGAVALLTHDGEPRHVPQLAVADTLEGLRALARFRRDQADAKCIAITGSSGKTTAKTLLAAALEACGSAPVHASQGSFNNHLGVPLSLATMPRQAVAGVFEVGTNHPGEIGPLSRLVAPDVAVLLNVHSAHAGNFPNPGALLAEKCAIAEGLSEDGVLVVQDQLELPAHLASRTNLVRFGDSSAAQVRLLGLEVQAEATRANYRIGKRTISARVPGGGLHRAQTLAAVLAVLDAMGLDLEAACQLPDSLIPQGRGNLQRVRGRTLLDDSYNANPQSMQATLTALLEDPQYPTKRYALLGEMLELGDESEAAHAALRSYCEQLDGVWLVGAAMAELANSLSPGKCLGHWSDLGKRQQTAGLLESVVARLQAEDVLLVKGSQRIFWQHNFVDQLRLELRGG